MSHSNSTTNYNLPQFVGTDKPAWLTDINGAFSNIDTAIKSAKDTADTAAGNATTANTAIGTLANLNTTEKTNLVGAVNEVNINLGTTSGVASQASGDATNALNKVTSLESALNLDTFASYEGNDLTKSNCSNAYGKLFTASNADGSVGKIYGFLGGVKSTSSNTDGYISFMTPFRPATDITIADSILMMQYGYSGSPNGEAFARTSMTIKTTGEVQIIVSAYYYNRTYNYYLAPCLYFMKDFGDTPTPTPSA